MWGLIPTPEQLLAWVDRLIALRHRQRGELHRLRRLLLSQIFLLEAIKRREGDAPQPARRRDGPRRRTTGRMYRQT